MMSAKTNFSRTMSHVYHQLFKQLQITEPSASTRNGQEHKLVRPSEEATQEPV